MPYQPQTPVLIDGTIAGTILRDNPDAKVLVIVGRTAEWIDRSRISTPGSYLAKNEQPTPANAAYRGVMQRRLEKR